MSSTLLLPPRAQLCNRSCSNKTHLMMTDGRRVVTGCQSAGTKPCRMLRVFARDTSGRNRGTRTLVLTAAMMAVLVAASQVALLRLTASQTTPSASTHLATTNHAPCLLPTASTAVTCYYDIVLNRWNVYECSDPQPCPAGQYSIGGGKN